MSNTYPKSCNIHPAAIIEEGALIGENVTVEAYAVIKSTVTIKDGAVIKFCCIDDITAIGENTIVAATAAYRIDTRS